MLDFLEDQQVTGLIPDSFDPRDVYLDEILAGETPELPPSYRIEGIPYQPQGDYPLCASFAASTLLAWKYNQRIKSIKGKKHLSQPHLFVTCGGNREGSSFRGNLNAAIKPGCIPYSVLPMPDVKYGAEENWLETMRAQAASVVTSDFTKLLGYAREQDNPERLKASIMTHGPLLVGVRAGKGDYYSGKGRRIAGYKDNHAVLLVGWTPTHWVIFESQWWGQKTAGYVTLDISYTFPSAYAVTELPENWREIRDEVRSAPYANALNHYGKPRDFELEQRTAVKLLDELKAFKNQSVLDAAGKFWPTLINAAAYGGYSISYRKFGVWQPGDLINFLYQFRRTGELIFDLDKPRTV